MIPAINPETLKSRKRTKNSHRPNEAKAEVVTSLNKMEKRMDNDIQKAPYTILKKTKAKSLSISSAVGGTPIMRNPTPAIIATMLRVNIDRVTSPARNLPLITESR